MQAPLVIAAGFALAIPVFAGFRARRSLGWAAFAVVAPAVLALPFAIDAGARVWRFVAAAVAALIVFKLVDLGLPRTKLPGWRAFFAYLANPTTAVFRCLAHERVVPHRESLARLGRAVLQAAIGAAAFVGATRLDLPRQWFLLDHAVRLVTLFVALVGILEIVVCALRLLVFQRVRDLMGPIFTAPTPAELWRRYNRMVGQFFHENVFRQIGGLRRPVLATLAVFAATAILHEYVFWVPIGRIQGYQTAFFMLQGLAVAATLRIRPRGRRRWPWTAGTFAFNVVSSVLFMANADQVTPFWTLRLP